MMSAVPVVAAQEHLVWSDEFNGEHSIPDPVNWKFETWWGRLGESRAGDVLCAWIWRGSL